jgi:UDP-glucose 4-epimerase
MKCVILGGGGFIGSHLASSLLRRGYKVRTFDRLERIVPDSDIETADLEWFQGDFQDQKDLASALEGVDVVYHLISTTIPQSSNENPLYDIQTNVVATLQMLDLMLELGIRRIVFVSSGGTVYGVPQRIPLTEDHPTNPICAYGISKLSIEKYLALYNHLHNLDYTILRLSNPYGAGQDGMRGQGVLAAFCSAVKQGLPLQIWGDGSVVRDYIHIDDVCEVMSGVLSYSGPERIFNIGSGVGASLNQLVDVLRQVSDAAVAVEYLQARNCDVPVNVLDIARAEHTLSWAPQIDLYQGVSRLLQEL